MFHFMPMLQIKKKYTKSVNKWPVHMHELQLWAKITYYWPSCIFIYIVYFLFSVYFNYFSLYLWVKINYTQNFLFYCNWTNQVTRAYARVQTSCGLKVQVVWFSMFWTCVVIWKYLLMGKYDNIIRNSITE